MGDLQRVHQISQQGVNLGLQAGTIVLSGKGFKVLGNNCDALPGNFEIPFAIQTYAFDIAILTALKAAACALIVYPDGHQDRRMHIQQPSPTR